MKVGVGFGGIFLWGSASRSSGVRGGNGLEIGNGRERAKFVRFRPSRTSVPTGLCEQGAKSALLIRRSATPSPLGKATKRPRANNSGDIATESMQIKDKSPAQINSYRASRVSAVPDRWREQSVQRTRSIRPWQRTFCPQLRNCPRTLHDR